VPITLALVDPSQTATVPTEADFAALTSRVATLESAVAALQSQPTPPPIAPPGSSNESPEGTKLTPGVGSIMDSTGAVWTISTSMLILRNNVNAGGHGWQSPEAVYHNHLVTIHGINSPANINWFYWNDSTNSYVPTTTPPGA